MPLYLLPPLSTPTPLQQHLFDIPQEPRSPPLPNPPLLRKHSRSPNHRQSINRRPHLKCRQRLNRRLPRQHRPPLNHRLFINRRRPPKYRPLRNHRLLR